MVVTIIAPPFIHLNSFQAIVLSHTTIALAAQNCHQQDSGAFTGEVSVEMLKSVGVECIILGHSERREYYREDSLAVSFKVNNVINKGLRPIYCCGETLNERKENEHFNIVEKQIKEGLFQLNEMELLNCANCLRTCLGYRNWRNSFSCSGARNTLIYTQDHC